MKFKLVENDDTCYRDNEIQISITGIKNTSIQLKVPMKIVFWYMINHEICHAKDNIGKPIKKRRITNLRQLDEYIRKHNVKEMECLKKPDDEFTKRLYDDAMAGLENNVQNLRESFNKKGFVDVPIPSEHQR